MSGRFIVSLDCEGKWGMADNLQPYHDRLLTDEALAQVYDDMLNLFEKYEIAATFAFVMAFTLDEDDRRRFATLFEVHESRPDAWLSYFQRQRKQGRVEGWFQPRALDAVQKHPRHEIASHGFCHRSLADGALSPAEAAAELDAAAAVAQAKGLTLRTLVYPRNAIGNLDVVVQKGYLGFRDQKPRRGRLAPLKSLAEEFDIWPRSERTPFQARPDIVRIPAGIFFNWRSGPRRVIPPSITVRRWKTLLDRTAEQDGVAHLWLHPHNLVTGPGTREPLEAILAYASRLQKAGRLEVVTQDVYCHQERARSEQTRDNR